ncbi:hypothetical protein EU527_01015 [Candidatus Thorarchaeota archaeon]|nr:MAG: hypothetical protein EU527_01015 [Candidatus Thorarchaeota archaeon]
MVHELTRLLTQAMSAKRDLKHVYYTRKNKESKLDVKELVAATIAVQKLLEELSNLERKSRVAKKMLQDRKAELTLKKWYTGLPRRVKDFVDKSKNLEQQHLRKYQEVLLQYLEEIGKELAKWIEDIVTLAEIPRVPKER